MLRIITAFILSFTLCNAYAWNSKGHLLVAQIAYDNLTPEAKILYTKYNKALNKTAYQSNFISSATWLDYMRIKDVHWYDKLHYIDIPFSKDGSTLPPIHEINALWGIKQAIVTLYSKRASFADKGLSLRILIHVVGDIHQPLHSTSLISNSLPAGDLGGNLFPLGKNSIAPQLHAYWDKGAGFLTGINVRNTARKLEKEWPCALANKLKKPEEWVEESHQLAITEAYNLDPESIPSKDYQLKAQNTVQRQIAFAGCRLAALLNKIAS